MAIIVVVLPLDVLGASALVLVQSEISQRVLIGVSTIEAIQTLAAL